MISKGIGLELYFRTHIDHCFNAELLNLHYNPSCGYKLYYCQTCLNDGLTLKPLVGMNMMVRTISSSEYILPE